MNFITEYGLFLAKTLTLLTGVAIVLILIISASFKRRTSTQEHINVKKINDHYQQMTDTLEKAMLSKSDLKKSRKIRQKNEKKKSKHTHDRENRYRRRIFVIDFEGDLMGSAVIQLRKEITAILTVATHADEVLLRLESSGGVVHAYGLAASQLARLRNKEIPLTVSVDKVAASGGYLMACVADKILAAPFAIIGSIGVITQIPNFNRLLKKHDIDFEQATGGEFKRTVTMFGETTEKGRQKLQEEVEGIHGLFKDFVKKQRPIVDIDKIATGEHWLGTHAHELKLIDELKTSDDYLMSLSESTDIYEVDYQAKKKLMDRITSAFSALTRRGDLMEQYTAAEQHISPMLKSQKDLRM